jgi:hypothetical protein
MIYITFLLPIFFGFSEAARRAGDFEYNRAFNVAGFIVLVMLIISLVVEFGPQVSFNFAH